MAPNQVNPLGLENRPGLLEAPLEQMSASPLPPYNVTSASNIQHVRKQRDAEMVVRTESYIDEDGRLHKIVKMVSLSNNAGVTRPLPAHLKSIHRSHT